MTPAEEPGLDYLIAAELGVDDEAAEEINRQAEAGQRELQRLADEADEAMRGTL